MKAMQVLLLQWMWSNISFCTSVQNSMEISLVANGEFSQMLSCDYFAKGQGLSFSKNNFGGKVTLKIQAVKIPCSHREENTAYGQGLSAS